LINENQVISMENLSVKNMMSNHKLARSVQELSLNRFKNIMLYKAGMGGMLLKWINGFLRVNYVMCVVIKTLNLH